MAVIVALPNGTDWFKASWVFRQLSEDMCRRYSQDNELRKYLVSELQELIRDVSSAVKPR